MMGGPAAHGVDAVVCRGPSDIELRRMESLPVGRHDVLIRTSVSGVSTGTDRWVMQGRFVWQDIRFPIVPGYQAAGIVEVVGEGVVDIVPGQAVVTTQGRAFPDVHSAWGTHASHIVSDRGTVLDATGIPPLRAALLVVAQVGYNAASRLLLEPGARVVVFGDGIVGTSAALAARARGFDVLLVGRHESRLASAAALGLATRLSDAAITDVLMDLAPSGVIDTVQNEAAFAAWFPALERGRGQVVYSGHSPGGITSWADMAALQKHELTVHFVSGMTPDRLKTTLELMASDRMPVDRLVGTVAGPGHAAQLMTTVAEGAVVSTAAAIDWRQET
jgi:2-desacetyl-2-hydroxyethyl bacteriochlorophyllide A dehydrogenase